jgi:hypothetical protein
MPRRGPDLRFCGPNGSCRIPSLPDLTRILCGLPATTDRPA